MKDTYKYCEIYIKFNTYEDIEIKIEYAYHQTHIIEINFFLLKQQKAQKHLFSVSFLE